MSSAFEMVGVSIASVVFGSFLDKKYNLNGLGTVGCFLVFFTAWAIHFILLVKKMEMGESKEESASKNPTEWQSESELRRQERQKK